ncbi:MAG: patatin-like phospholipase family protein [Myxococcales bacterium]|nr:patatin-like phospholipase family protein [Myxococcales bacterium]
MFDGVVFAGGGCRCFWQAGFYVEAQPRLCIEPAYAAAASAGAALGTVSLAGVGSRALENFKRHAAGNSRNIYPELLLSKEPMFPHEGLFRAAILETIDAETLVTIQTGPKLRIALTRSPQSRVPSGARLAAAIVAYKLEGWARGRVHTRWASRLGYSVEWACADECEDIQELADLLLQTSCTPPFTPAFEREGRPVLDGGLTNNVPVAALPECERILVLLTKKYHQLPESQRVTYVEPSEAIPIGGWDYSDPDALQHAYDLGRRDGERFATNRGDF